MKRVLAKQLARTKFFYRALLSSTILSGMFGSWALAAEQPAVSALNGKVELGVGTVDTDTLGNDELLYGGASLSIPLADRYGVQIDFSVTDIYGETAVGGGGHLFTRDPGSYLVGFIGGYSDLGSAEAGWGGVEAELYLDKFSIEAAAGAVDVDYDAGSDLTKGFGLIDVAYYAQENLRLSVGASSIAEFESGHVAAEWMIDSMPLSIKGDVGVGEDDLVHASVGLSFYFGGNDAGKSLIRRHREDDPRNRALEIFGAGAAGVAGAVPPATCIPYFGYTLPPANAYGYCTGWAPVPE
jgi:hypothetical protein